MVTRLLCVLLLGTMLGCRSDEPSEKLAYERHLGCTDFETVWRDPVQPTREEFIEVWDAPEPCCGSFLTFGGTAPDGRAAYRVDFDRGAQEILDVKARQLQGSGAQCARMSYQIFLEEGFSNCHAEGSLDRTDRLCHPSKMPGLWGSLDGIQAAAGCIDRVEMTDRGAWSARMQWSGTPGGIKPRIYTYALNKGKRCGGGVSGLRRGKITVLPQGEWVTIGQSVCLNTPDKADGSEAFFINGEMRTISESVEWRATPDVGFSGIWLNFYTGGSLEKAQNRSPRDQKLWMANFKLETCGRSRQ